MILQSLFVQASCSTEKHLIIPLFARICPHFLTLFLFCFPFFLFLLPLFCFYMGFFYCPALFSLIHSFLICLFLLCHAIPSVLSFILPPSCFPSFLLCCGYCPPPSPPFPLQNLPQVKQVQALRQVKERLQAENRALARVVAKLSQSACSQLPAIDL